MQTLKLSDGTVLENSYAALTHDRLFFYIQNGMTLAEVFALMSNPEKTGNIIYAAGEYSVEYQGYTVLMSVSTGVNGLITGALSK